MTQSVIEGKNQKTNMSVCNNININIIEDGRRSAVLLNAVLSNCWIKAKFTCSTLSQSFNDACQNLNIIRLTDIFTLFDITFKLFASAGGLSGAFNSYMSQSNVHS